MSHQQSERVTDDNFFNVNHQPRLEHEQDEHVRSLAVAMEIVKEALGTEPARLHLLSYYEQVEIMNVASKAGTEAFVSTLIALLPPHLRLHAAGAWGNVV